MAVDWSTLTAAKTTDGSIKNWVNRSDIPVTNVLIEAQALIYDKLRVREMLTSDEISLASGNYRSLLPTDFLDPVKLTPYGWGDPLDYLSEDRFIQPRNTDGTKITAAEPSAWTIIGTYYWFDIQLSAAFGGQMVFYELPDNLSVSNTTNFLTTRYPIILRHMCMSLAYENMKDAERTTEYRQKAEAEIGEANATNELSRRGQR